MCVFVCVGAPKPRAGLPQTISSTFSHLYHSQAKMGTAASGGGGPCMASEQRVTPSTGHSRRKMLDSMEMVAAAL